MERLKNMGLKKSMFILSGCCLIISLLLVLLVYLICNYIRGGFPSGGVELGTDGILVLEQPTSEQQKILTIFTYIQFLSCIIFPIIGLGIAGMLFYHIKLKVPISVLQTGIKRIQNKDLNFSISINSCDELGQICAAFEMMRGELLKTNRELWRQAEERKRLNAAFSHNLRNPVTVLKGTVKLLRQGVQDSKALERLENYTLRIEHYVEAMSSIQRLEQIPIKISRIACLMLHAELEDTARMLAPQLKVFICIPDMEIVYLDHGLFLTVAENLIGNAVRFAETKILLCIAVKREFLSLSVVDDGLGFTDKILQNGPRPFEKQAEDSLHFGMGLYSCQILCQKHGGTLELKNSKENGAEAIAYFRINTKT